MLEPEELEEAFEKGESKKVTDSIMELIKKCVDILTGKEA